MKHAKNRSISGVGSFSSLLFLLFFLILIGQASIAYADTELENETLYRIRHVLNALTPLINEAEQAQDKHARVQFRYDWLRSDIESIKRALPVKEFDILAL
jgi:RAQPRD family integrative conjugative element protein